MSLERRFNDLKNQKVDMNVFDNGNESNNIVNVANQTPQLESSDSTFEGLKNSGLKVKTFLMDKIWFIPLLLSFILLSFLMTRFWKSKNNIRKESEIDYASQISDAEAVDFLNQDEIHITSHPQEEVMEASIKLDVARAYIEADDKDSAINILEEVLVEGSPRHQKQAKKILKNL